MNRKKRKRQGNNKKNIIPTESTDKKEPIIRPAPYVIVVHGPPKVGKSSLIKTLVRHYTNHNFTDIAGPINIVAGDEQRRIRFVECPNNVNGMIDAAKYADAVIFVIDVSYGFEMETLEFCHLLKIHGMPIVMGVFTHLDCFPNKHVDSELILTIESKNSFWEEICKEAQIFCLSVPVDGVYTDPDVSKLASFILGMEFHPLPWRAAHPYVLADHLEDVTPVRRSPRHATCDRDIIFYGYLRGCDIKKGTKVHIAGIHDFPLANITSVAEPPPLPYINGKINIDEHNNLDEEETQLKKNIFRMGSYLMFKVCNVPSEMVTNYDPCQPILVGGISPGEDILGCISARFERHGLHMKSLKTKDPIIVSEGWRRYRTTPIYALEDLSEILKFTPEDEPCSAMFWGPCPTPGSGVVAVQTLADKKAAFRILASGKVLDFSRDSHIYMKTRVGTPCKIINKTALIKDMFTSYIDVNLYKDTKIKTVCGIHGKVNEAATKKLLSKLEWKDCQPSEGITKCTFVRKIHSSDTVYMHTFVDVPKFNSLIAPKFTKPSNRIWTNSTKESEKHGAHVVWASFERKLAPESLRVKMSKLLEKKLKFPSMKRREPEERRAVIIVHQLSNPIATAAIEEAYQARFERHGLHMKSLKTKDPIIVSEGWRRYRTTPIYALEDLSEILKFTPEDKPCSAMFWGPCPTPGSGVVAVQTLADKKAAFRILASGKVLDFSRDSHIYMRTRVGTPCKIINKTALIKDMFTSYIDVNQYKDTKIKTVCGIQGKVNEAATKKLLSKLEWKDCQPSEGIAKCTFVRKIHSSDTVYMHTFVDVPKFNSLIAPKFPKPSNRVWTNSTKESEKHGAHVVWASFERKLAPESLRVKMSKLLEKKLKFPSMKRREPEERRAVIIVNQLSNPIATAAVEEAYQKKEDIRNNIRRGIVTTIFRKRKDLG